MLGSGYSISSLCVPMLCLKPRAAHSASKVKHCKARARSLRPDWAGKVDVLFYKVNILFCAQPAPRRPSPNHDSVSGLKCTQPVICLLGFQFSSTGMPQAEGFCTNCGKWGKCKRCLWCRDGGPCYCSKECQLAHWHLHKQVCPARAWRKEAKASGFLRALQAMLPDEIIFFEIAPLTSNIRTRADDAVRTRADGAVRNKKQGRLVPRDPD